MQLDFSTRILHILNYTVRLNGYIHAALGRTCAQLKLGQSVASVSRSLNLIGRVAGKVLIIGAAASQSSQSPSRSVAHYTASATTRRESPRQLYRFQCPWRRLTLLQRRYGDLKQMRTQMACARRVVSIRASASGQRAVWPSRWKWHCRREVV